MNDTSKIMTAIGVFLIIYSTVLINLGIVEPPEIDFIKLYIDTTVLYGGVFILLALMMDDWDKIKILEGRIEYLEDNCKAAIKETVNCEKSEKDN